MDRPYSWRTAPPGHVLRDERRPTPGHGFELCGWSEPPREDVGEAAKVIGDRNQKLAENVAALDAQLDSNDYVRVYLPWAWVRGSWEAAEAPVVLDQAPGSPTIIHTATFNMEYGQGCTHRVDGASVGEKRAAIGWHAYAMAAIAPAATDPDRRVTNRNSGSVASDPRTPDRTNASS